MKKVIRALVGLTAILSGWVLAASALHVVVSPGQVVVVPKNEVSLKDTFVNTRHWTAADLEAHASVVDRLTVTKHAGALAHIPQVVAQR
jgi:predicted transcriptional regulator